ncbi:hypothetical protein GIB67_000198, partial [Kingdonia uniflora]
DGTIIRGQNEISHPTTGSMQPIEKVHHLLPEIIFRTFFALFYRSMLLILRLLVMSVAPATAYRQKCTAIVEAIIELLEISIQKLLAMSASQAAVTVSKLTQFLEA